MLELYQFETCPWCADVREKLSQLGLDYICRNAPPHRPDKDRVLIAISGSRKVPFLVDPDNDVYLSGTREILAYLDETFGNGAASGKLNEKTNGAARETTGTEANRNVANAGRGFWNSGAG